MPQTTVHPAPLFRPITEKSSRFVPSHLRCVRCQLFGRRSTLCFRVAACGELPRVFPLTPLLVVGWLATAVAFFLAIR